MTFWEHLDELRGSIVRMLIAATACAVVAFCLKDPLFDIVLAPRSSSFITYQLLQTEPFHLDLMNTGLAEQFTIHMKTAFVAGLIVASPYLLFMLYRFVAPALYDGERREVRRVVGFGYAMFMVGVVLNYFLVFPLTVHFLGTYQVSADVRNMLTLQSYVDTLLMMSLVMGIVFEIPVVSWLLARLGLIRAEWMTHYRRHAIVVILTVAAAITPTTDIFTLLVVAMPIWLLYEASIWIVERVNKLTSKQVDELTS